MENEEKRPPQPHTVETLSSDMVKVLEHPEEGLIKKLIKEEEAHEEEKKNFSPESGRNKLMVFASFFLVAVAFAVLFLFFFNRDALTIQVKPEFIPLVYTDESSYFAVDGLNKDELGQSIYAKLRSTEVQEDGVEGIYMTEAKQVVGLRRFVELMGGNLLLTKDSYVDDNFLIGFANKQTTDLFILIKIRSHTDAFLTMRNWEHKMFSDLHDLFGVAITPETSYLLTKDFEDGIMQNQNARILYDKEGNIVVAYVYADPTSLVITDTESALGEVIMRLAASKVKK